MEFVLDVHCHTLASGHAYSSVLEYAAEAARIGLQLIAITDHAPAMPGSANEVHFMNYSVIPNEIYGVTIMMGVELNILNITGEIDVSERTLKTLNPVIASLHPPTYRFTNEEMPEEDKKKEITEAILNVIDNDYVNILGHLGDPRYPFDAECVVKKAMESGKLLEINNASLKPTNFRFGSSDTMVELLKLCKKYNYPVVIGSDAHFALDAGKFDEAKILLDEIDFPNSLIANTSKELFLDLLKGGANEP